MELNTEAIELLKGIKEELSTMRAIDGRVKGLEDQIKELRTNRLPQDGISVDGVEGKKFSFCRAILGIRTKDWDGHNAGYERDVIKETREKALSLGTAASVGNLVPTEVVDDIIEILRTKMILSQLGITFLSNLEGSPIQFPRQTGSATGYWVAEGAPITESDQTSDLLSLTPHKCAALTRFSNTLLRTGIANGDVESMVRSDLAEVLARTIQTAVFHGTGTGSQPEGMFNVSGINSVTFDMTNDGSIVNSLIRMMEEIAADDADEGGMAWAMHSRAKYRFARVKHSESSIPILALRGMTLAEGLAPAMLDIPYYTTNDIAIDTSATPDETDIMLAVWRHVVLGTWGGMELAVSGEAGNAFEQDQTLVRALQEVDLLLRHEEAVCAGVDLELTGVNN